MVTLTSKMEAKSTLQKLLKKIATEEEYDDYSVVEKDINGTSITSYCFFITLCSEKKKDLKLFVKVPAWSEKLREVSPVSCPFTVELYFYRTLREIYEIIEDTNGVPEENRFRMPKFYGSSDEYLYETLAMEDLVAGGYEDFDRQTAADLEYMTTGIALMAQFHALSIAYSQHDPEGFAKTSKLLTMDMAKVKPWLKSVTPKMLSNAVEAAETHRAKLENHFAKPHSIDQIEAFYMGHNKHILVHGDFKPTNLMHRRRNGKLEIVVVDFQLVRDGDPVMELLYFIYTSTDETFRRTHYEDLLDLYYEKLRTSLLRLHVDPEVYSEKTYRARLGECIMLGLVMSVVLLPVVFVDESKAPKFNADDAEMTDFAVEASALFKERFNGILNNYVEWGLL